MHDVPGARRGVGVSARHVLTLAYHFPPVGGAGVQRMLQLSRRLPALGWEQTVITGPGSSDSSWRPRDDWPGGHGRAATCCACPGRSRPTTCLGKAASSGGCASRRAGGGGGRRAGLAESIDRDVDVVHASVAPYSTAESADASRGGSAGRSCSTSRIRGRWTRCWCIRAARTGGSSADAWGACSAPPTSS